MVQKIKLRDSLYILKESENKYIFISTATRKIKKFKVDSLVKDFISNLNSESSEEDLIKKLSNKYEKKTFFPV